MHKEWQRIVRTNTGGEYHCLAAHSIGCFDCVRLWMHGVAEVFHSKCFSHEKIFATNSHYIGNSLQDESESRESSPLKNYNKFDRNDSAILRGDSKGKNFLFFSFFSSTNALLN